MIGMKKLMFAIGLGLISGSVYAACMGNGAICYDDQRVTLGQRPNLPVLSSTTISTLNGVAVGDTVICKTCANVAGSYALCIATATSGIPFIVSGSTDVIQCK